MDKNTVSHLGRTPRSGYRSFFIAHNGAKLNKPLDAGRGLGGVKCGFTKEA